MISLLQTPICTRYIRNNNATYSDLNEIVFGRFEKQPFLLCWRKQLFVHISLPGCVFTSAFWRQLYGDIVDAVWFCGKEYPSPLAVRLFW